MNNGNAAKALPRGPKYPEKALKLTDHSSGYPSGHSWAIRTGTGLFSQLRLDRASGPT
jgi:hypothetical protein